MKKLSSCVLSLGLLLSLYYPVFAAEESIDASKLNNLEVNHSEEEFDYTELLNNSKKDTLEEKSTADKGIIPISGLNNKETSEKDGSKKDSNVKKEKKEFKLNVSRISGNDRYNTAVEISKKYYKNSDVVIIASGQQYIDALVGGSLVSQIKAPMLLVKKDNLPTVVKDELVRLKPKNIIIIGGENTISSKVESEISKISNIERIAGNNRYLTAQKIAFSRYNFNSEKYHLPIGDNYVGIDAKNFPDALIAGSIVGQIEGKYLSYIHPNANKNMLSKPYGLVFGGEFSIPYGASEKMRVFGLDRYETSVNGARYFKEITKKDLKTVILADGRNYPDALSASTIAGMETGTVLLTRNNKIPEVVLDYLKEGNVDKVIIVGGNNSVSLEIEKEIANIVYMK